VAQPSRIDRALVARGLARNEAEAIELIADDRVVVNGAPVLNAARQVTSKDQLLVLAVERFVSRGGLKLESALEHFDQLNQSVPVRGSRVLDAGASTGGFVDCLLQRGAAAVVACDVGRSLLHPRLAADPRVEVRDSVNARDLGDMVRNGMLPGNFDIVVADLSFISLRTVMASLIAAARSSGQLLLLVKPQFEASKQEVDRGGGVITEPSIRQRCVDEVIASLEQHGARLSGGVESGVPGPAGNREHWVRAVKV
jgi:23S rRNA (cytidine1920-2'-O)/16S rRNA (cytidine1409-2'-O)-methyltransferase